MNIKHCTSGYQSTPNSFCPDIRFKDDRRTNGGPGNSKKSVADGKLCNTPILLQLVTNGNTSLALRPPAMLSQSQEIQTGIRRRTLTHWTMRRPAEE